jgi:outer membrane biosynthesis protein TonB
MAVEVNFKDLRAAVVDLNKSGLIKKQVVLVGVAKEKIYEDFMAAMDKIEDDPETKEFPKGAEIALAYFNKMVDEEKKDKKATVEKAKPAKPAKEKPAKAAKAKTEKAEKPAKEKRDKPKKEKKEAGPSRKLKLYTEWAKSKQKLTAEQLHKMQSDLSLNTIKGWVKGWANGKRLPAGAKK